MGKAREPTLSKLFMSLIAAADEVVQDVAKELSAVFGEVDFFSKKFSFNFTDYYKEEMGENLFRHFISFRNLIPMTTLPDIKLATNQLEERFSTPLGNRRINIDPGYLRLEHIILATTKSYSHRPYLREGIYADLTLIYHGKSFQPLEWTYPDYREEEVISLFNLLRKEYGQILRGRPHRSC